jgi:hypothetical protein
MMTLRVLAGAFFAAASHSAANTTAAAALQANRPSPQLWSVGASADDSLLLLSTPAPQTPTQLLCNTCSAVNTQHGMC